MGIARTALWSRRTLLAGAVGAVGAVGASVVTSVTSTAPAFTASSLQLGVNNQDESDACTGVKSSGVSAFHGWATAASGATALFGEGPNGVHGTGSAVGVLGTGSGVGGWGVYGLANNSGYGVIGESPANDGVYGKSTDAAGVYGYSKNEYGVHGYGANASGIYGETPSGASGVAGSSQYGSGVYGVGQSSTGVTGEGPVVGIRGLSSAGRGAVLSGGAAALRLLPSAAASHPGTGRRGDLFLDRAGRLWYCSGGAAWTRLA